VLADVLLVPAQRSVNARFLRSAAARLRDVHPVVIGVTGSFGKTSTKFAIAGLIAEPDQVLATPSSFNTPLGVCRTINEQLGSNHRFFVVEMGAYTRGDIAELARFVAPSIGVLTAIGPAHLDRFGSMDAIERAKYELIASLDSDGAAIVNSDDHAVRALADKTGHVKVVRYGMDPGGRPDVTARGVETTTTGTRLTVVVSTSGETLDAETRLLGRHAIGHVLAAVAVALETGSSLVELGRRIAALHPVEHRLQLIKGAGGVTVVDDAYNSNPDGASAALEVLAHMPASKRVVVTPGIVELGELQHDANVAFGQQAASVADTLIVVARVNRAAILEGARRAGSADVIVVDSLAQATEKLGGVLAAGDAVLFENDLPDQYEG
jgi:UDP-N-acetylmuramoyl-tripeptide--D-alanyl-D-alanine ligase